MRDGSASSPVISMKELFTRVIVAAIAIPALVLVVLKGGVALVAFVSILTALGFWEYLKLTKAHVRPFPELTVLAVLLAGNWAVFYFGLQMMTLAVYVCFAFTSLSAVFTRDVGGTASRIVTSFFGVFYISLFNSFVLLRNLNTEPSDARADGAYWILFAFAVIWICDTAAYFIGAPFGRHKMSPVVSPKKSWEGFVGGLFFGTIAGLVFSLFALKHLPKWEIALVALAVTVIGQLGDFVESIFKRAYGAKDSSHIIPGHGGVLDRFDSLLFALPTLYIALVVFVY